MCLDPLEPRRSQLSHSNLTARLHRLSCSQFASMESPTERMRREVFEKEAKEKSKTKGEL